MTLLENINLNINLVSQKTQKYLDNRQIEDYRNHQKKLVKWLLSFGKDPEKVEGYSEYTVKRSLYHIDRFHRFVWKNLEDGYTLTLTTDHADEFMKHIAYQDYSNSFKASVQKSLKRYFKYQSVELGEKQWGPDMTFYEKTILHIQETFLQERKELR